MSYDYTLIGGQFAGGENAVFEEKAREVQVGDFVGRGFLILDPNDPSKRRLGHARLPLSAADAMSLNRHEKDQDGRPLRWPFRGTVYEDGAETVEELEVYIVSYSFSDTVRVMLQAAPPRRY